MSISKGANRRRSENFATFEHLTPRSQGGTNEESNLALSHSKCNQARKCEPREPLLRRVAEATV